MRKLIMWNIITLDGYFEGEKPWELSFHEVIWGEELEQFSLEQLHSADYLVFGRRTYEGMAAHFQAAEGEIPRLMNQLPKLVFSRSLDSADWYNTRLIREQAAEEIRKLKSEGDGDMYVFGSAELSETFIREELFDEYRIGISPAILGSGRALFGRGLPSRKLPLLSSQQLSNGGMVLRYGKPSGPAE